MIRPSLFEYRRGLRKQDFLLHTFPSPNLLPWSSYSTRSSVKIILEVPDDSYVNSNGQLVAHIRTGLGFEEFKSAIIDALSQLPKQKHPETTSSTSAITTAGHSENMSSNAATSTGLQPETTTSTAATSTAPPLERTTVHQVMEDRRKRLEADKAVKDAAEKERLRSIAQARHEATTQENPVSKQSQYAQEQRKRKREAQAERERILREIENDKAARKEREAERRALAKAEAVDAGKKTDSADVKTPQHWAPVFFAGLLPSATLVMVPIQGYTGAYASDQGMVSKAVALGYNAASTGGNMLVGALGTVLGFGRATGSTGESPPHNSNEHLGAVATGEGMRFRTMRRQDDDTEHQFYNGNQLNFEPRKRDDDEQ
ncbi:MAG: hypothetical protein L6R40_000986 [Gallowayella cf. fulva]|nr:MAG: hypothetical protein L6R40_000986 [Xanthomendoza cf. fulva]